MLGLVVFLLAVAIPLGIVVLVVKAPEAERNIYDHSPVSRLSCALVFSLAAVLGALWVFRGTGPEYASAMGLFLGVPAAAIAALLATAGQPFLVGRSKVVATLSGVIITILTALGTYRRFLRPGSDKFLFRGFRNRHRLVADWHCGSAYWRPCWFIAQSSFQPQAA